jgi:hypothetical protein
VALIADLFAKPPLGVQLGLVRDPLPTTGFQVIRNGDRTMVLTSPFRIGDQPNMRIGVASITDAEDAVAIHGRIVAALWRDAVTGAEAADLIRKVALA